MQNVLYLHVLTLSPKLFFCSIAPQTHHRRADQAWRAFRGLQPGDRRKGDFPGPGSEDRVVEGPCRLREAVLQEKKREKTMKTPSVTEKRSEEQWKRAGRWRWAALILVSMAIFSHALWSGLFDRRTGQQWVALDCGTGSTRHRSRLDDAFGGFDSHHDLC